MGTKVRLQGGPGDGEWHGPADGADVIEVYAVRPHPPYIHPSQTKVDTHLYDLKGYYLGVVPDEWTTFDPANGGVWTTKIQSEPEPRAPEVVFALIVAAIMCLVLTIGVLHWFTRVAA